MDITDLASSDDINTKDIYDGLGSKCRAELG